MPAPGEPVWTDEDRGYALAWAEEQADRCPGCAQPFAEAMAKANQFGYRAQIVRCHACAAKDREAASFTRAEGADTAGLQVQLTATPADLTTSRRRGEAVGAHA
ncbi:MAG: hypothetical protein ACRDYV_12515 [Acidimicrobiia bacterium]